MLTPVWFILVAIAIPCQAYLDDRVLLDQHWTGFSPTVDGYRREDFKASMQDRRHASARQIDNEPDKRSAGRDLLRAETKPLMVRDTRSTRVRSRETFLHFRSDNARNPDIAGRSIRHVLSDLERVSKRERLDEATVRMSRTERDSSRTLDTRKQERETRHRTLYSTGGKGSYRREDERRRTTADAPTWVKEDSRRTVRSTHRDLVSSANRLKSSRTSRCEDGASIVHQNVGSMEHIERQTPTDRRALSLERLSRLTETRAQGHKLNTRFRASHRHEENNHVSRVGVERQGSRRRVNDQVNRNHRARDATCQSRLIVDERNNQHGTAKKIPFRSKTLSSRNIFTERHQMTQQRRRTILPLQTSPERVRVDSRLRNERMVSALSRLPVHEIISSRTTSTVRTQNHREGRDPIRNERPNKHTQRRMSKSLPSIHDTSHHEVRRTGFEKQNGIGASNEHTSVHFLAKRTVPNVSDKQQQRHDRSFKPHDSRIDVRSMDDSERRNSYILNKRPARSERQVSVQSVSAVRRQLDVDNARFDWTNTRETSIQVYRTRCQARNDNVVPMPVSFSARIAKRSASEMVLEQRITAERRARALASSTRFRYVERVEGRRKYRHNHNDEQIRFVNSHERVAVDTRQTSGEGRLAFARMRNARHVRKNFSYGESRRSASAHRRLKTNSNEAMPDTIKSTRSSREAGDSYRDSPEDARSSHIRTERYSFERRQINKRDTDRAVSIGHRDTTITPEPLKTAPHSSRRMFQTVRQAGFGEQKELNYHEKQKSPLFWDELASSYFRTNGNLLETVLTVGVVAWMTMSPKRKLIN